MRGSFNLDTIETMITIDPVALTAKLCLALSLKVALRLEGPSDYDSMQKLSDFNIVKIIWQVLC